MATYQIEGMKILLPSPKVRAKNSDLVMTIVGTVWSKDGEQIGMERKQITRDMVRGDGFGYTFDKTTGTGTLTLADGKRGRRPSAGASEDDVQAAIDAALADGEDAD